MFPSSAPYNGPGSSQAITADRLGLYASLGTVMNGVTQLQPVLDPDSIDVSTPVLTSQLAIGLPSAAAIIAGQAVTLPAMTLFLAPYTQTYIDAAVVGGGTLLDFAPETLLAQPSGSFAGSYLIGSTLVAASAVALPGSAILSATWEASSTNAAGGWGPAFLDAYGNGLVVRTSAGGGGIYAAQNSAAAGSALILLPQHLASTGGIHTFAFGLARTASANVYRVTLAIDGSPLVDQLLPVALPASFFPAFVSDGCTVYLTQWGWSNDDGTPLAGWIAQAQPTGSPDPGELGRHVWLVETLDTPASILNLNARKSLTTRVAALRERTAFLQGAYL